MLARSTSRTSSVTNVQLLLAMETKDVLNGRFKDSCLLPERGVADPETRIYLAPLEDHIQTSQIDLSTTFCV